MSRQCKICSLILNLQDIWWTFSKLFLISVTFHSSKKRFLSTDLLFITHNKRKIMLLTKAFTECDLNPPASTLTETGNLSKIFEVQGEITLEP